MLKSLINVKGVSMRDVMVHLRTPLYRNAYALIISDTASSVLGMLYWMLAARYYSTHAVGLNSAVISTMMFLAGLAFTNLKGALIRFLPRAGRGTLSLVGWAYVVGTLGALITSTVFLLGINIWMPKGGFFDLTPAFVFTFIAATALWSVFSLQDIILTGLRQTTWVPIENLIFSIVKIVLLIMFAISFQSYGIFVSWTIPVVLTIIPINLLIFGKLIPRHAEASAPTAAPLVVRQIVPFVLGDFVGAVFSLMSTTLLPVLVVSMAGTNANAYFYLAWISAYPMILISANTVSSLTAEVAMDESKLLYYGQRALTNMLRLLVPLALFLLLAAPYVLLVFGAEYSRESAWLLRLLGLAAIPYAINALSMGFSRVRRQMRWVIAVQAAMCLLMLSLSYVLIQLYGITGVGLAWLISQSVVAAVVLFTQLRSLVWTSKALTP
jgi:O-antigen/teichoic acid export membrane protein